MPPTIHLVRHAQGVHNLSFDNHGIRDPDLTEVGKKQCADLAKAFPYNSEITAIVASPLKRTIYTALESFPAPIKRKALKVIALPEIQETSDLPCDTGSLVKDLEEEFDGKPVDLKLVKEVGDSWCDKREGTPWAPYADNIHERAKKARQWLRNLDEGNVVVVTHGGFLHYLTEDWHGHDKFPGTGWANTEFRSYTFDPNSGDDASLIETEESRKRRSGTEKPLTADEQLNLAKIAQKTWGHHGFQK